jgi:uncharacterized membrane protein YidH (DUF202 family)
MKLPKSWYQLTEAQAFAAAPYILQEMSISNKMKVFEVLIAPEDVPKYVKMTPDKVLIQLKRIEFLWKTNLVEPIVESFSIDNVPYFFPAHRFTTLCIAEFAFACDYFDAMLAQGNYKSEKAQPEMLNSIMAVLCRPAKLESDNGDVREKFNESAIEKRAKIFALAPPQYKAYFLLYFLGCKKALSEQFSVLFKKPLKENGAKTYQRPIDYAWFKIIFDLSEEGTFGKYEDVCYQNLYTILHYLTNKYYDLQELKYESK